MARPGRISSMLVLGMIVCTVALLSATTTWAGIVGVNYGQVANDLPSPSEVANFIVEQGIGKVKIYDANTSVIQAFANTQIQLVIGLPNEQLDEMATNTTAAFNWVQENVANYYPATQIVGVAVGNEVLTSAPTLAGSLLQAMNNLHSALVNLQLDGVVKVSTPHSMSILSNSYPPSAGQFNASYAASTLQPLLNFILVTGSYVMVNVYPFFAYSSNPAQVPLNYALFLPSQEVTDPTTGLQYVNLFDAQLDSFYAAMTSLNTEFINLPVVVTETGWPSMGDPSELGADIENAQDYNGNLVKAILSGKGTPMKPNVSIEAYVFALFNENMKPGPTSERNYGLFYPNMQPVYNLNFTSGDSTVNEGPLNYSPQPSPTPGGGPDTPSPPSPPPPSVPDTSSGTTSYCIAKPDASASSLQTALDYACGPGGADCGPLQPGQSCFDPNTLWAHASYAFNSFYQKNGRTSASCFFAGNAVVNTTSPSTSTCTYPTN
ncbi:unnamed protein product [Calypogeia fissa]